MSKSWSQLEREIACGQCGSYADECQCDVAREIQIDLASYITTARVRQRMIDYDLAMSQRALREYGYTQ